MTPWKGIPRDGHRHSLRYTPEIGLVYIHNDADLIEPSDAAHQVTRIQVCAVADIELIEDTG